MPLLNRQSLTDEIAWLADERLPARAAATESYPVRFDHCFRRIAYDTATGQEWDEAASRPFYRNATRPQLLRAARALRVMAASPAACRAWNRESIGYRT